MEREVCLRCGGEMICLGQEKIQLGKCGVFLGAWPNILSGALDDDIYVCKNCKKLEFYAVDEPERDGEGMAQVRCPRCGQLHELDDPKCPHCGHRLMD